ncbi:hypothetical protein PHYBLDRAFT_141393 [Phycomyces blakesleeanus NRRL 1555(-)]|uniref:Uncharacterized protein n=1 Tax=Phycomyces blakesleeanus (strain ATCC 8743b / DSM 1359 / FGSC 10004 / NBRC 33097 / NRRL 1555) TaxID=763407 RepID=A0A163E9J3_PHYB8|nr:hypothetical protein PHYBLDRAFT_141393 [Phycomyces blakesleeanus NRRL 1555(-)]OAD77510.1 hypothetical protein PHYBLDRAFT_141393 [Phycomyces blakesleeanus NRRL 1555(-)]|eukprot:XP_018295550.1 hypothetical protein PHYBLDRAFT_141393 [Phycomyces blakesleeanus NRRL 1555(-)]
MLNNTEEDQKPCGRTSSTEPPTASASVGPKARALRRVTPDTYHIVYRSVSQQ